jgi:MtN3 and saliva related transmembrane protein
VCTLESDGCGTHKRRTIRTRDTSGISLGMYVIFTMAIVLWFSYGLVLSAWPIVIANLITFLLSAIILVLKARHNSCSEKLSDLGTRIADRTRRGYARDDRARGGQLGGALRLSRPRR